jgi:hypothetical protein
MEHIPDVFMPVTGEHKMRGQSSPRVPCTKAKQ